MITTTSHRFFKIVVTIFIVLILFGIILWLIQAELGESEYNYTINNEVELSDTVLLSVDYSLVHIYSELYDVLVYEDSDGNYYKSIAGQKPYSGGTHELLRSITKVTLLYEIPKEHYDGHITCLKNNTKHCYNL